MCSLDTSKFRICMMQMTQIVNFVCLESCVVSYRPGAGSEQHQSMRAVTRKHAYAVQMLRIAVTATFQAG